MSRRDDDPYRTPHDDEVREGKPHEPGEGRNPLAYGILAALACDTLFNVPTVLLLPLVRPPNIAAAIGKLVLAVNMLVGYVGGRAAVRAGLSHLDGRAQMIMAGAVTVLSHLVANLTELVHQSLRPAYAVAVQRQAAAASSVSAGSAFAWFAVVVLLTRFGFAMGTYAQAKREGRVQEDEAGLD